MLAKRNIINVLNLKGSLFMHPSYGPPTLGIGEKFVWIKQLQIMEQKC